jgi:hypothetical protein
LFVIIVEKARSDWFFKFVRTSSSFGVKLRHATLHGLGFDRSNGIIIVPGPPSVTDSSPGRARETLIHAAIPPSD